MKENIWCNTMLVAYTALPEIVKSIEKTVDLKVKSGFQSRHFSFGLSTEEFLNSILQLNQRKIRLINIKVLIDRVLELLPEADTAFLCLRYFERKTFQEVSERLGCSLRTVFRRNERIVRRVSAELERLGYGAEWFFKEYEDDGYIKAVVTRLESADYMTM